MAAFAITGGVYCADGNTVGSNAILTTADPLDPTEKVVCYDGRIERGVNEWTLSGRVKVTAGGLTQKGWRSEGDGGNCGLCAGFVVVTFLNTQYAFAPSRMYAYYSTTDNAITFSITGERFRIL